MPKCVAVCGGPCRCTHRLRAYRAKPLRVEVSVCDNANFECSKSDIVFTMYIRPKRHVRSVVVVAYWLCAATSQLADAQNTQAYRAVAREIFRELIETNTTASVGDNTRAAELMAVRFREAGFPQEDVQVLAP